MEMKYLNENRSKIKKIILAPAIIEYANLTNRFLANFPDHYIQTFDDKGSNKKLVKHGTPNRFTGNQLITLNLNGAGIYFTPNRFTKKRKKNLCEGVNAWFMEIDDIPKEEQWKKIKQSPLIPSAVVETRNSLHCYWFSRDGKIENFDQIIRGLIQFFNSDGSCKDIGRVLRIPGFYHNKEAPYQVTIKSENYQRSYKEVQMMRAFPYQEVKKEAKIKSKGANDFWKAVSQLDNRTVLERLSGTHMVNGEIFSFRKRSTGTYYIDVNGKPANAWLDEEGKIGSGKKGGPTCIQWLEYYGHTKGAIAKWIKENCKDLLPEAVLIENKNYSKKKSKKGEDEDERKSIADQLIEMTMDQDVTLFHDQFNEAYIQIRENGSSLVLKVQSKRFRLWLMKLRWESEQKSTAECHLKDAIGLLSARAQFEGEEYHLENRVASFEEAFWYDLVNKKGEAIKITKDGWRIESPPILFRRQSHQKEQVISQSPGKISTVLKFVKLKKEESKILFQVYLVAALVPDIPHPIPVFYGPQGSSKSTISKILKRLIDPSSIEIMSLPSANELVQQISHHYGAYYDNIQRISDSVSDMLCRAVTGEGGSKRSLYTNDDDFIYSYRRCIGLNGINVVAQKPDLLDRSILFELERIPKSECMTERKFWQMFEEAHGSIVSGMFQTLSKAMKIHPTINLKKLPRMADFAHWGYAIAEALGIGGQKFLEAYEVNMAEQNQEVLEGTPLATAIVEFMKERDQWRGSSSDLLNNLEKIAGDLCLDMSAKNWPKAANILSRRLNEILPNLKQAGILIKRLKDESGVKGRGIEIKKLTVDTVDLAVPADSINSKSDDKDDVDGLVENEMQIEQVIRSAEEVFGMEKEDNSNKPNNKK
jgi:hypothetical protein